MEVALTEDMSASGSVGQVDPAEYRDLAVSEPAFLFEPPVCEWCSERVAFSLCFLHLPCLRARSVSCL
jgi:hypothetical protein